MLLWSAVILLIVQVMTAMVLTQLLSEYIQDESEPREIRFEVYKYFGTFFRSSLTMFEITLANWVPPCRLLMENVAKWYAILFVAYKLSVGFAVIKVITAVFIQQTLKVAANDQDLMIMQKRSQAAKT